MSVYRLHFLVEFQACAGCLHNSLEFICDKRRHWASTKNNFSSQWIWFILECTPCSCTESILDCPPFSCKEQRLWHEIVMLPTWLTSLQVMPNWFEKFPGQAWLAEALRLKHSKPVASQTSFSEAFDYPTVATLHEVISKNAHSLVLPEGSQGSDSVEDRAGAVANISHLMAKLQAWKIALMPGMAHSFKKFYSAQQLYYSIDVATHAKSGSQGLRVMCIRALRALFPHMHEDVWLSAYVSKLPAASTITRHMVSLEVAMILMEREVAKMSTCARVRYGLVDCSPAWGLDFLWFQELSVPGGDGLISLYSDCVRWIRGFQEWQKKYKDRGLQSNQVFSTSRPTELHVAAKSGEDAEIAWRDHSQSALIGLQASAIPQTYHYQLQSIATRLEVHTYTPVVIASGFSNLSHKLAGCLHSFFLHLGNLESLKSHMDSFISVTTDLGTESGLTEYRSSNVTDLLPVWIRRPPPALELDIEGDLPELEDDMEPTEPAQSAQASIQVCFKQHKRLHCWFYLLRAITKTVQKFISFVVLLFWTRLAMGAVEKQCHHSVASVPSGGLGFLLNLKSNVKWKIVLTKESEKPWMHNHCQMTLLDFLFWLHAFWLKLKKTTF